MGIENMNADLLFPIDFPTMRKALEKLRSAPITSFVPRDIPAEEEPPADTSPVVSVVVTTYNHEHCLAQALESAVSQKLSVPFEILVGEDCSTDNTLAIAREFKARYPQLIRLITAEKNCHGGNSARLIMRARGKYVAILEGDDFWNSPDKLELQYQALEAHPECSWSASDTDKFYQWNGKTEFSSLRRRGLLDVAAHMGEREQVLEGRFWLDTCTIFCRTEILRNAYLSNPLFTMRLRLLDLAIRLELARHGKLFFIDQALGTYRINSLGTSACRIKDPRKIMDFYLDSLLILCYYMPDVLTPDEQRQVFWNYAAKLCAIASMMHDPEFVRKLKDFFGKIGFRPGRKENIYLLAGSNRLFGEPLRMIRKLRGCP